MRQQQIPDESNVAYRVITDAISRAGDHVDHATARLIAAAIHPGSGTALEAFAASGRFDVVKLERELRQNRYPFPQEVWRGALLGYVAWQRTRQPWMRGLSAGQKRRLAESAATAHEQLPLPFAEGEQGPPRNTQHSG